MQIMAGGDHSSHDIMTLNSKRLLWSMSESAMLRTFSLNHLAGKRMG